MYEAYGWALGQLLQNQLLTNHKSHRTLIVGSDLF